MYAIRSYYEDCQPGHQGQGRSLARAAEWSQAMVFQLRDSVIQVDTFITEEELRARFV